MTRSRILAVLAALLVGGCAGCDWRPGPGPTPGPVGGSSSGGQASTGGSAGAPQGGVGGQPSTCELGCAQLARLGCPEGDFTGCATLADQVNAARMTVMDCACWAMARTVAEARACGNLRCLGGGQ